MIENLSKITHLPQNLRKAGYRLRLSFVLDNHSSKKCWEKIFFFPKLDSFSTLHCPQPIQYSNLSFDMTKWSVVTNIHRKFESFWASSFGATKVYYLPFRFKDGVFKRMSLPKYFCTVYSFWFATAATER